MGWKPYAMLGTSGKTLHPGNAKSKSFKGSVSNFTHHAENLFTEQLTHNENPHHHGPELEWVFT